MSLRAIAASLFSFAFVAAFLILWAKVPGPIGMVVAAIVAVGTLIGLGAIDDNGERRDAAWRKAAPDIASPAPPIAILAADPQLPWILEQERLAAEAAEAEAAEAAAAEAGATALLAKVSTTAGTPEPGVPAGRPDESAKPG